MSSGNTHQGKCLCGAVTVTATAAKDHIGACHCSMCRKWGGGPFLAVECGSDVEFTGNESIGVFDSSDWAERGFCRQCGTHLFYRLKEEGFYAIPVGLFDTTDWVLTEEVFIDEKPEFYAFSQDTKKLTGAELFAQFGAQQ